MKISEEEYIKRATESYCDSLIRSKLYENFCDGKTDEESVLKSNFEIFIDNLVKESDVQIKKNFDE